ncbi:hypothetical protein D7V97_26585 [Corallococcus sp. CA053C]|nr:hypothetical protein D7V97_26585 [Corallococcus sp. CA053C]
MPQHDQAASVSVMLFLNPSYDGDSAFKVFGPPKKLSRVPCVGELVALGTDDYGDAAEYEVVLVRHTPRHDEIVADVYLRRVDFLSVIKSVSADPTDPNSPWRPRSWPRDLG